MAVGDSYNDIGMLQAADQALLFHPSAKVQADYPAFPVALSYLALQRGVEQFLTGQQVEIAAA
jgi:phosphoserine/homoserine phosphotransferase